MTSAGIEPATFRFVAQHLNRCATAVPTSWNTYVINTQQLVKVPGIRWYNLQELTALVV